MMKEVDQSRNLHLHLPRQINKGEEIEIKAKLSHSMENGWRKDADGKRIPANQVTLFTCYFNQQEIFRAKLGAGISPDPYIAFFFKPNQSGLIQVRWLQSDKKEFIQSAKIKVI
ncbi:thiosulfate oxidation carrier complex protein SoxZ [Magnetococcales bacterium HHB-1]